MIEIFKQIESTTLYFAPKSLCIPGLICLTAGLCLWLGGLRWKSMTAALAGIIAGGTGAFFVFNGHLAATIISAVIAAILAVAFRKAVIVMIGAMLIASIILLTPALIGYTNTADWPLENTETAMSITESVSTARTIMVFVCDNIAEAIKETSTENFTIALVTGLVIAVIGYFLPSLIGAITFSVAGTCIVFVGMILLLLFKGAYPISSIYANTRIYTPVFLGMVVFGTICELVICSPFKTKTDKKTDEDGEGK
jgi:hypothetical protein